MTIEVIWRNGGKSVVNGVKSESNLRDRRGGGRVRAKLRRPLKQEKPLFEDVSKMISHVHHQEFYDDYVRQPPIAVATKPGTVPRWRGWTCWTMAARNL